MFFAILLLISQVVFGFELSSFAFSDFFSFWPIVASAIPSGISISAISYLVFSLLIGHNIFHIILHTVLLLSAVVFMRKISHHSPFAFRLEHVVPIGVYIIGFTCLFISAYFRGGGSFPPVAITPLFEELSFLSSFSYGCNSRSVSFSNFVSPLQFNERIRARWLPAFHSSMLEKGGAGLRVSIVLPSILSAVSFSILLFFLAVEMGLPPWIAFLAPIVVLSVAGYGFFDLAYPPGSSRRIDHVSRTKAGETSFFHPTMQVLVGNRSSGFSLAIAAITYLYLATAFKTGRSSGKGMLFVGALIGLLPAFHPQAFVGLSIFTWIALLAHRRDIDSFFLGYFTGVVLNSPRLLPVLRGVSFEPLWRQYIRLGRYFSSVQYCFEWLGLFPLFGLVCPLFFCSPHESPLVLASLLTFLFSTYISIDHPRQFDYFTFHFGALPLTAVFFLVFLHRISTHRGFSDDLRGCLSCASLAVFALTVTSSSAGFRLQIWQSESVWDTDDIAIAEWIKGNTRPDAVFLCPERDMSSIAALAGRVTFCPSFSTAYELGLNLTTVATRAKEYCEVEDNDQKFQDVQFLVRAENGRGPCGDVNMSEVRWRLVTKVGGYTVYEQIA
jgi:hypothetical protein